MRLALLLSLLLSTTVFSADLSPAVTAQARIAQLEFQVTDLQAENAVLGARLALALQTLGRTEREQVKRAIETDAGCALEWTATPPVCVKAAK